MKTSKQGDEGQMYYATPLPKRVYSEGSDQEMDIWIQVVKHAKKKTKCQSVFVQLAVPPADWPGHKTVSLTVTPFKKSCGKDDATHR